MQASHDAWTEHGASAAGAVIVLKCSHRRHSLVRVIVAAARALCALLNQVPNRHGLQVCDCDGAVVGSACSLSEQRLSVAVFATRAGELAVRW